MLKDTIIANRSYRGYDESRSVTKEELESFIDYARLAPSSANIQPLKYGLAWEEESVRKIQKVTKWAGALPELHLPYKGTCPTAFIVVCQDTGISSNLNMFQKDVGIVAQTILLAASEVGLSGCMIGSFGASALKEGLDLGENLVPMLVIAIGKGAEQIVLTEVEDGESTKYYRDSEGIHYVPKRKLKDITIEL